MFGRKKQGVDVRTANRMASDDGYVILDVRTAPERLEARPPQSVHITLDTLAIHIDKLKDRKVLVICRSGDRSATAARFLNDRGIEALNIDGGIIAWARAGLPVKTGA